VCIKGPSWQQCQVSYPHQPPVSHHVAQEMQPPPWRRCQPHNHSSCYLTFRQEICPGKAQVCQPQVCQAGTDTQVAPGPAVAARLAATQWSGELILCLLGGRCCLEPKTERSLLPQIHIHV
jgi:hypothetical protein